MDIVIINKKTKEVIATFKGTIEDGKYGCDEDYEVIYTPKAWFKQKSGKIYLVNYHKLVIN